MHNRPHEDIDPPPLADRKNETREENKMKSFVPVAKPLALAVAFAAAPALAVQFEFENGLKASVDTTLTYGIAIRAADRDPALIGIANGGTSRSVNEDDGDLN